LFKSITLALLTTSTLFAADCREHYPEGFPSQKVDTVLCKKSFVIGYSYETKTPLWAIEHLSKGRLHNSYALEGFRFHRDYALKRKDRSTTSDYIYTTQDRSPLVPFEDMDHDHFAAHETFLMSNIAPQDYTLNRHGWVYLERGVRELAEVYGEVVVITGVAFLDNSEPQRIGNHKVAVPSHYYKAVYAPNTVDGPKMWAWMVPNKAIDPSKMRDYRTSVDAVESRLGIDLFPDLDPALQARIESKSIPL